MVGGRGRGSGRALFCLTFALHFTKLLSFTDTLFQGLNFTREDSLISSNSQFKLKFFTLPLSSPNDNGKLYLGVTFGEYLVWVANLNNPVDEGSHPRFIIDYYANMKISYNNSDGGSQFIMIYSSGAAKPTSADAVLLENGNFILQKTFANGSTYLLWQSYDYPTNILLPTMRLGFNGKTGQVWNLTSWVGPKTSALGSFTLGMDPNDTKQLVIWWQGKPYWTSGPLNDEGIFPNLRFKSTPQDASFQYYSNETETFLFYLASSTELDYIVLDSMGRLDKGANVSCNTNDPALGAGCVPPISPGCRKPHDYVSWGDVKHGHMRQLKTGHQSERTENVALYDCGTMCFNNCSCLFFSPTTQDNTGCEMWDQGFEFEDNPHGRPIYFIRNRFTNPPNSPEKHKDAAKMREVVMIASATGMAGVALGILTSFYICHLLRKNGQKEAPERSTQKMLLSEIRGIATPYPVNGVGMKLNKNEMHIFSFEIVVVATNNFSAANKLGEGGFGPVYKGKLPDGQEIAIKRLSTNSRQGLTEFINEIKLIGKLQHPNLVKLYGFCIGKEERMLIYEYLPNKSLDLYLFDSNNIIMLDNWKTRLSILQGVAQGLLYLHKSSNLGVIHRDLKPSNILLDEDMKPKISDFGIARIFGLKESEEITNRVVGTFGYMPPEYVSNGVISTKTDVFSFGVLILELVSGKKNCFYPSYPHNLIGYAWKLWNEDKAHQLIDPILNGKWTPNEMLRYIHIGLVCVQGHAKDRPTMQDVVSYLSNETVELAEPKILLNETVKDTNLPAGTNEENHSINDVTLSPLDGR